MKKLTFLVMTCTLLLGCYEFPLVSPFSSSPSFEYATPLTVCHMQEDGSFVQLEIYDWYLGTHLGHGDYKLDIDNDGYTAIGACAGSQDDCDDTNFLIHPNAAETCGDGIDNNCDGKIDEGCWICNIPILHVPENNAVMDNGCKNRTDPIIWKFEWEACQDATQYHLLVDRTNAKTPFIDTIVKKPEFEFVIKGYYVIDQNIMNWNWKVRTHVNDIWTPWSLHHKFNIEPLNTDCP